MPRPLSPFIQEFIASRAEIDARAYNTHIAMEIVLKNGSVYPVATTALSMTSLSRRLAGTNQAVSVNLGSPVSFFGKLLGAPEIQFSQNDNSDGSTQAIIGNLDYLLTALIPEENRLFDNATVTVYLCFRKADGSYEGLIYGVGRVRSAEGDENVAPLSYVSDMSDKSVTGGDREVTQKCLNIFGVNAGNSFCPAQHIPNGATCSHIFEDEENGCIFWGGESGFKGIPFFNPNTPPEGYYPPNLGGGGGGGGGGIIDIPWNGGGFGRGDDMFGGCADEMSFYKTPDGWTRGTELRAGMLLIDHRQRVGVIKKVERIWSSFRYEIKSARGARGIFSADHPVLTDMMDEKGIALYLLTGGGEGNAEVFDIFQSQRERKIIGDDESIKIVDYSRGTAALTAFSLDIAPEGYVLKISMDAPNEYISGTDAGSGFGGHNLKPMYRGLDLIFANRGDFMV